jgi:hypothetical protein
MSNKILFSFGEFYNQSFFFDMNHQKGDYLLDKLIGKGGQGKVFK